MQDTGDSIGNNIANNDVYRKAVIENKHDYDSIDYLLKSLEMEKVKFRIKTPRGCVTVGEKLIQCWVY